MPSEAAFVKNALQGIIISLSFALVILLIATKNIVQSILSIVAVIEVVMSVLAVMYWNGMEMGISESIAIVVLIGFSVDYTVHLSHSYMESKFESRNDRMR